MFVNKIRRQVVINNNTPPEKTEHKKHFESVLKQLTSPPPLKTVPVDIRQKLEKTWSPQKKDPKSLIKNSIKAVEEHFKMAPNETISLEKVTAFTLLEKRKPLEISYGVKGLVGSRSKMEDTHFYTPLSDGILMGVLDGHGGQDVAKYAKTRFPDVFKDMLVLNQGDVRLAMEKSVLFLQNEIQEGLGQYQGAALTICYVENKTNLITTMTLGDVEAKIYRDLKSFPLSLIRNWGSKKDSRRGAFALNDLSLEDKWQKKTNPKSIRFPNDGQNQNLNLSRALGDGFLSIYRCRPGISQKPKITLAEIHPQDILILASDGFWDYVSEEEILHILQSKQESDLNRLAQDLAKFALLTKLSKDNVTVMVVSVAEAINDFEKRSNGKDEDCI